MSGDATMILSRRVNAPTEHTASREVEQVLDGAPTVDNPEWGWVDFGGTDVFDEQILKNAIADELNLEFWGPERHRVFDGGSKRFVRQATVVAAMVAVLAGLLWVADRAQTADQQTAVEAGRATGADTDSAIGQVAREENSAAGTGLRSASVAEEPEAALEHAQAMANTESAIVALAQSLNQATEDDLSSALVAPSTTASPTTAPTTAAPTTAPTTAPPVTEPPASAPVAEADQPAADQSSVAAAGTGTPETGEPDEVVTNPADGSADGVDTPAPTTEAPPTTAHPDGWVDAGHGVFVPPVLLQIRFCESTDNYAAANPSSSARGAYQFLRGSWANYGHRDRYGVAEAHLATPAQQDEAALITWQRSGTSPWNASKHCWG